MNWLSGIRQAGEWASGSARTRQAAIVVLLGAGVIAAVGLHLAFLTRTPVVFIDEPWYANAAWNWLTTGQNFDPMHSPARPAIPWAYGATAPWALSFALLGLGFAQARLVAWLSGGLLLLATLWVGRRSYGTIVGLLGALFLAVSVPYLHSGHYARPDVVLAALVMAAFGAVLTALETERWWLHAAAGLLIGIGVDVHLNGGVMAIGLAAVYAVAYGRQVLRRPGPWLFGGTAALAFAGLEVPRRLTLGADAVRGVSVALTQSHRPPILDLSLMNLLRSVDNEIGRYHFYENSLDLALIAAALVLLLARRSKADRMLLAFVGTAFAGFVLFVGNKAADMYAILFYPLFMLVVAEALVSLVRASRAHLPGRLFAVALIALFLFNGALHTARPMGENRGYDYEAITDRIQAVTPEGSHVMGMPHWWLGLADYDYTSALSLGIYHLLDGYSVEEGLAAARPDILVVDSALRGLLVEEGYYSDEGFGYYYLPRQEFEGFLAQRGEKLLEFTDPWHGRFEIYGIDWD